MGTTDLSAIQNLDDLNEPEEKPKPNHVKKKPSNAQDSVMSTQIVLAVIVIAAILVVRFVLPALYETLYAQYIDFVSEPPVWDLDGIFNIGAWIPLFMV